MLEPYDVVSFGNKTFYLDRKATKYKNKMNRNILTEKYLSRQKGTGLNTLKKKFHRDNITWHNSFG